MYKINILTDIGLCGGVKRALDLVFKKRENNPGCPLYLLDQIVHNKIIIRKLKNLGIKDLKDEKEKGCIILPAHGTTAEERTALKDREILDTICPEILKIASFIKARLKEGFDIIYYGKKDHREVRSVLSIDPDHIHLITSVDDIKNLNLKNPHLAFTNQTTVKDSDVKKIAAALKAKFKNIEIYDAVCGVVLKREHDLIKNGKDCDVILIAGDSLSNNTQTLYQIGKAIKERCFLIENLSDLEKIAFLENDCIGIASGTSCPEAFVEKIIKKLNATKR